MASYIFEHIELSWNYSRLSENPNITMEDVINHPEIEWDIRRLIKNPSITWEHVKNNQYF